MMTDISTENALGADLSEAERARIRAEVRYALIAAQELRPAEKNKSKIEMVFAYLSNGFVLLLIGSLIGSVLVPHFQRIYESRRQQAVLMQDCLGQFLLYSNSIWQEYYAILPLTQHTDIDKDEYLKYVQELANIKLKRYDAYAKVQALSVVFKENRTDKDNSTSIETTLKNHAIRLNIASTAIDKWLKDIYCTPTRREKSPCASFDVTFDSFSEYTRIKSLVVEIGNNDSENVASLMVKRINQY